MKIVILSDSFPPSGLGGAEVIAFNAAKAFFNKGHDVSVITTTNKKTDAGEVIVEGITVYKIYSDYHKRWRAYKSLVNSNVVSELGEILKKLKPDVVHAHNVHEHLSYASLNKASKYSKAVFLTVHDVMSVHYGKLGTFIDKNGKVKTDSITPLKQLWQYRLGYNPFRNMIIRHCLKSVDVIFSVSHALKYVLQSGGLSKIEVLNNGINISDWVLDEDKLDLFKDKYNLTNKKVMFFGGRLSEAKGASIAIEVLAEVSKSLEDVTLLIVGDRTKVGDSIINLAKKLGVASKIVFTGWIEHKDIKYAYGGSNLVLVLSKYFDPFPTVNLEAMASKRPVIGTAFGGTPEAVLDRVTGYIVNPIDLKSTSEKVLDLLRDKEKSKSFGLAGFERVSRIFNEDFWADEMLSRYDTIIQNNK